MKITCLVLAGALMGSLHESQSSAGDPPPLTGPLPQAMVLTEMAVRVTNPSQVPLQVSWRGAVVGSIAPGATATVPIRHEKLAELREVELEGYFIVPGRFASVLPRVRCLLMPSATEVWSPKDPAPGIDHLKSVSELDGSRPGTLRRPVRMVVTNPSHYNSMRISWQGRAIAFIPPSGAQVVEIQDVHLAKDWLLYARFLRGDAGNVEDRRLEEWIPMQQTDFLLGSGQRWTPQYGCAPCEAPCWTEPTSNIGYDSGQSGGSRKPNTATVAVTNETSRVARIACLGRIHLTLSPKESGRFVLESAQLPEILHLEAFGYAKSEDMVPEYSIKAWITKPNAYVWTLRPPVLDEAR